ncbi:hypothetical protein QAD02_013484 [Eretmocerus hayati]|uniref:Uncharacterized protein n=1 Tax=Eretmocerus hayati TaxID=131215 RepID=A0ACC2P5J5_9HYME|nr:hypothetical protein QAD02_013484 [Eretmocerus hayati]
MSDSSEADQGQDPLNPNSDDENTTNEQAEPDTLALAKFYREEAGIPRTGIVPTNLIHKFDPKQPLRDYLVPRQDTKGLITYEPAQILKIANSRKELEITNEEPLNPKRGHMKKARHSDVYNVLIKRDGPIGDEDNELLDKNPDDDLQSEAAVQSEEDVENILQSPKRGRTQRPKKVGDKVISLPSVLFCLNFFHYAWRPLTPYVNVHLLHL